MKNLLQKILKILARAILAKYKPEVIGITGSVGKTGAKEAIRTVLSTKFAVRQNIKNYNNEIGLPLTIIGAESPGRSPVGWLRVFFLAVKLLVKTDENYPKILILEMAADKPGDIDYLTDMARCGIGVLTAIAESHLENFKSIETVKREKLTIIKKLDKSGWAVLNFDDKRIVSAKKETQARTVTLAIDNQADVIAQEVRIKFPSAGLPADETGINFKLTHNGSFTPVFLPGFISKAGVYAALAGAAIGIIKGLNLVEISQALKNYLPANGRMKLIPGIKNTFIIDDSYNSSPSSSLLALDTLGNIHSHNRKYAIFGDMAELGSYCEAGHLEVGKAVVRNRIDVLVVVGEKSRDIARGAKAAGMKEDHIFHFAAPEEAGKFIQERIKSFDIILVKGSQIARMEKVVEEIMAEPLKAPELLVRQGREWK